MRLPGSRSYQLVRLLVQVKGHQTRNFSGSLNYQNQLSVRTNDTLIISPLTNLFKSSKVIRIASVRWASLNSTNSPTSSPSSISPSSSHLPPTDRYPPPLSKESASSSPETKIDSPEVAGKSVSPSTSGDPSDKAPEISVEDLKNFIVPDPPPPPELLPPAPISPVTFDMSSWLPTGWVCSMLLFFENYMPYYVAIIACTFIGRIILTPSMIFAQKQAAKMSLVSPKISELMEKKRVAEQIGNKEEIHKLSFKIMEIHRSTDAFKIKNMAVGPVSTIMVFGSFFLAVRKMAAGGHEPMKEGGIGPFLDLTAVDPSYILPTWTALTLFGILKIGIEFGPSGANAVSTSAIQDLLRKTSVYLIPVVIFFVTSRMPSAIGLYWATNNSLSIIQSLIMLRPSVRKALKIPPIVTKQKAAKKGFINSVKHNWAEIKKSWNNLLENRQLRKLASEQLHQFDRSGVGPLRKTFDYDPTKVNAKIKKMN